MTLWLARDPQTRKSTMDPQVQAVLDDLKALGPPPDDEAPEARRLADFRCKTALIRRFSPPPTRLESVAHHIVSTPTGPLPVRLYRPSLGRLPLLVHVHGGGGVAGTLEGYDPAMRALARTTGWLVAVPDYRLAPEHRFPAQIVDVSSALEGLMEASGELNFQTERTVITGDSLGASIAFSVMDMIQSPWRARLAGSVLLYPNADLRADAAYPSRRFEDGKIISQSGLERQIQLYVRDVHRGEPLASPIAASNLNGGPPTLLITCEHDPLRDEGEALVRRLREAGVAVDHTRLEGQCHGLLQLGGWVDAAAGLVDLIAAWLNGTSTPAKL